MSGARRVVRFTFWSNFGTFLLLALEMGSFMYHLPLMVSLVTALILAGAVFFQVWYLRHHYGVTKVEEFYLAGDERDRNIAYRVHNSCLYFLTQALEGLLVAVFLLLLAGVTSAVALGTWILEIGFTILILSNCQYYYLWQKYDAA
ncbi:hypothetical protein D1831_07200 [Lactiplantibacillus garii]|uniref:Uncharacterized protein n=1 Tax=Lactiplantibacillus garii TaxID=2306423 RepID=A0A3R8KLF0_9LACO|nr:hypothetical protein [Lactiplantibacillus garii]RRK10444.1 hypothetical protein D1831_07200 [Lactiplantibacillus garii]